MALRDLLGFRRRPSGPRPDLAPILAGHSIEVLPRVAARIADFRAILPPGTRVYVTHVEGTPVGDLVETARRLRREDFPVMPHVPARLVHDRAMLDDWLGRYRDAGVEEALVIAGGAVAPHGAFTSSIELLGTGLFERHGFRRLHVAGHPEGNRLVDRDGSTREADAALRWKEDFATRTGIAMAVVTQFTFDAKPVIDWAERLRGIGVGLPVHAGIAGPGSIRTLVRYGYACGIGASLRILEERTADVGRLILPYDPGAVLADLAAHRRARPECGIAQVHFFPLGGFERTVAWIEAASRPAGRRGHGAETGLT